VEYPERRKMRMMAMTTTMINWRVKNQIKKSNHIRFISGNMAHKSYKLVQKQRQTEKERNKNIQHTTHSTC